MRGARFPDRARAIASNLLNASRCVLRGDLNGLRASLAGALVRRQVEQALARPRPHHYVYDPETDMLLPLVYWSRFQGLLTGNPEVPGYFDCLWYPLLDRLPLSDGIVFDVGCHYGYTSAWFAQRARQVFCFEPNPQNQRYVAEVLRIRSLSNVELVRSAVGERRGDAMLHVKPLPGHHSLADIGASETIDRVPVPVLALDEFADERGIDQIALIKIDVEGFEPEVLRGAQRLLRRRAVDAIIFEHSPAFYLQRGIDPAEPLTILADYGYRVEDLDGAPVPLDVARADQSQRDLLAFPA